MSWLSAGGVPRADPRLCADLARAGPRPLAFRQGLPVKGSEAVAAAVTGTA